MPYRPIRRHPYKHVAGLHGGGGRRTDSLSMGSKRLRTETPRSSRNIVPGASLNRLGDPRHQLVRCFRRLGGDIPGEHDRRADRDRPRGRCILSVGVRDDDLLVVGATRRGSGGRCRARRRRRRRSVVRGGVAPRLPVLGDLHAQPLGRPPRTTRPSRGRPSRSAPRRSAPPDRAARSPSPRCRRAGRKGRSSSPAPDRGPSTKEPSTRSRSIARSATDRRRDGGALAEHASGAGVRAHDAGGIGGRSVSPTSSLPR